MFFYTKNSNQVITVKKSGMPCPKGSMDDVSAAT